MSARWWAPQRATLEPDAVVLELARSGDLGSAMLAAHRAGAAALEQTASEPLPSEVGLVRTMAAARQRFAPVVVQAVAKSLDPTYAGLLVRDVLDDAEQAVVTLYRTSVRKGVSPPAAVQRAAAVYGVPNEFLGRYAALATDPKANPMALLDAADRTLLTYVSSVVKTETEPIAKAEKWDEKKHPRDGEGQFAPKGEGAYQVAPPEKTGPPRHHYTREEMRRALGLGEAAPERVAEEAEAPAPPERLQRPQRLQRIQRLTPTQRATKKPTVRARPQRTLTRASDKHHRAQAQRQRVQHQINRQAVLADVEERTRAAVRMADIPSLGPPMMEPIGGPRGSYTRLGSPLVVRMPKEDSNAFQGRLGNETMLTKHPGVKIFRWGHLQAMADVRPEDPTNFSIDLAHRAEVANPAKAVLEASPDYHEPSATQITAQEIKKTRLGTDAYMALAMADLAQRENWGEPHRETEHMRALDPYVPFGTVPVDADGNVIDDQGKFLVHAKPSSRDVTARRPVPTIDEYVILKGAYVSDPKPEGAWGLDPNQPYMLVGPPGSGVGDMILPQQFWDDENGVIVNRWFLEPIDETRATGIITGHVEKADDPYAFEPEREKPKKRPARRLSQEEMRQRLGLRHWSETEHPRDAEGQFTNKYAGKSKRLTRTQRLARTERPKRATLAQPKVKARQVHGKLTSSLTQTIWGPALQRKLTERHESLPAMPALHDQSVFKLMTLAEYGEIVGLLDDDEFHKIREPGGEGARLHSAARDVLRQMHGSSVDALPRRMGQLVDDDPTAEEPFVAMSYPIDDMPDVERFAEELYHYQETNDEVNKLDIFLQETELAVYATAYAQDQVLIEMDEDIDFSKPMNLVYIGRYQAKELERGTSEETLRPLIHPTGGGEGSYPMDGSVANPRVQLYRVTAQRYRAVQGQE